MKVKTVTKKFPKSFILDTNVILHDATCINQFQEHDIIIPLTVIEELDHIAGGCLIGLSRNAGIPEAASGERNCCHSEEGIYEKRAEILHERQSLDRGGFGRPDRLIVRLMRTALHLTRDMWNILMRSTPTRQPLSLPHYDRSCVCRWNAQHSFATLAGVARSQTNRTPF